MILKNIFKTVLLYALLVCLAGCAAKAISPENEESTQETLNKKGVKNMILKASFKGTSPAAESNSAPLILSNTPQYDSNKKLTPINSVSPLVIPKGARMFIKRAKVEFTGVYGLRESTELAPYIGLVFEYSAPGGFCDVILNTNFNEWIDINQQIQAPTQDTKIWAGSAILPSGNYSSDLQFLVDTRNLQSLYLSSPIVAEILLDVEVAQ